MLRRICCEKILSLLLCGALILPLAGCELTINGKQIFGKEEEKQQRQIIIKLPTEQQQQEEKQPKQEAKKEEKKQEDVKLDYVCAQCGKQMYKSMLNGSHENDFCSVNCQDKWYNTQKELNENKYNSLTASCSPSTYSS